MKTINLSYIITTKNKKKYLQHVLDKLLENIQPDEEIVVVDSDSSDGTKEYLTELFQQGHIHKFLSEQDYAQAHGCNKALLLAEGKLLKIINDDDIFYYKGIRKCKEFMLEHPEIDMLGMDGAPANCNEKEFNYYSTYPEYINAFNKWKSEKTPFSFCDLGLMIRKSSLSYLGLFNPAFFRLDAEYTFKASSLAKTKIAWYTGHCWIRLANENSISVRHPKNMVDEWTTLEMIYLGKIPQKEKQLIVFMVLKFIKSKIDEILYLFNIKKQKIILQNESANNYLWEEFYKNAELWLEEINKNSNSSFYY
jgi:glycosyltransferase involved in cell wall biosynthesis